MFLTLVFPEHTCLLDNSMLGRKSKILAFLLHRRPAFRQPSFCYLNNYVVHGRRIQQGQTSIPTEKRSIFPCTEALIMLLVLLFTHLYKIMKLKTTEPLICMHKWFLSLFLLLISYFSTVNIPGWWLILVLIFQVWKMRFCVSLSYHKASLHCPGGSYRLLVWTSGKVMQDRQKSMCSTSRKKKCTW